MVTIFKDAIRCAAINEVLKSEVNDPVCFLLIEDVTAYNGSLPKSDVAPTPKAAFLVGEALRGVDLALLKIESLDLEGVFKLRDSQLRDIMLWCEDLKQALIARYVTGTPAPSPTSAKPH